MFSESIEQFRRRKEAEAQQKDSPRVSMNEVAKQQAPEQPSYRGGANVSPAGDHKESGMKIFFTKKYDRFIKLQGNRQLNKTKIGRIKKDIENGLDLLKYCPIIVAEKGEKLEVIDGQHRLQVAKELGSQVWYIIADELTLLEIARMNSNTEKWKNKDFINCYKSQGNEHYAKLDEFMEKYNFPLSVSLALLTKGVILVDGGGNHIKNDFQGGTVQITMAQEAEMVADTIMKFEGFSFRHSRAFVISICKVLEGKKIEIDEVINSYLANKDKLVGQANWKNYLVNLETIVNIGKSKRRVIY